MGPTPATQIKPPTCAGTLASAASKLTGITEVAGNEVLTCIIRTLNIKIERLVACRFKAEANGLSYARRAASDDDWSFHSS